MPVLYLSEVETNKTLDMIQGGMRQVDVVITHKM